VPLHIGDDKMPEPQDIPAKKVLISSNEIIAHRGGVIDVALTSRRGGAIERDDLCGILADCLQDVSFASAVLAMLYFCYTVGFLFLFTFAVGNEID
jgi:hypothetical protein